MKSVLQELKKPVLNNFTIIRSYSFEEEEIIKWIYTLYCPNGIEADVTYRNGSIYKDLAKPRLKYDLNPQYPGVEKADCRNLPLENNSIESIMFDPPFLIRKGKRFDTRSSARASQNMYSYFESNKELLAMYNASLGEFARVLKKKGILVVKCQDIIHSNKFLSYHNDIINACKELKLTIVDLFLRLNKIVPIKNKYHKQNFSRRFHCYYLVFKKA